MKAVKSRGPRAKRDRSVGILSLDPERVEMLICTRRKQVVHVETVGIEPIRCSVTPESSISPADGDVLEPEKHASGDDPVVPAIRRLLQRTQHSTNEAWVLLHESDVSEREMALPPVPRRVLSRALMLELERTIPWRLEDVDVIWEARKTWVGQDAEAAQTGKRKWQWDVHAIIVPKSLMLYYQRIFSGADLSVAGFVPGNSLGGVTLGHERRTKGESVGSCSLPRLDSEAERLRIRAEVRQHVTPLLEAAILVLAYAGRPKAGTSPVLRMLPAKRPRAFTSLAGRFSKVVSIMLLLSSIMMFFAVRALEQQTLARKGEALEEQLAMTEKEAKEVVRLAAEARRLAERAKILSDLDQRLQDASELLLLLSRVLPENVLVESVSIQGKRLIQLTARGTSATSTLEALAATGRFKTLELAGPIALFNSNTRLESDEDIQNERFSLIGEMQ